jgi:transposase
MRKKSSRRRIDVDVEELDRVIDAAENGPLSPADRQKLKTALHALVERLVQKRNTEKTNSVLEPKAPPTPTGTPPEAEKPAPAGHGRNGADAFTGADRTAIAHSALDAGDACPGCGEGKVYRQKEPATLIRVIGQAPLKATVFEMERLRCNACGEVFTASPPQSAGEEKFDATAVAMIALLKYGTGMPFHRMERLEAQLGMPLPAATQWELMEQCAKQLKRIQGEFIRQAAQGGVVHNDDTGMRILQMARRSDDGRTGTFTSGIVSVCAGGWKIALYFSGWKHAGENLADVLKQRDPGIAPPIQMCDALSRNSPKLIETLPGNCLAHGRRQFTEVAESFPDACRYVLESLGAVYGFDAEAKKRGLTAEERLTFHQTHSAPVMEDLRQWMEAQLAEHKTEPNSGLGKAISYLLRHWMKLTLFLRQQGAPLDNNIVERALKKAILHRKNALFYKTMNGARVGHIFMSLIHTCELNKVNPFDYLTELLRHRAEGAVRPAEWMPWNYRRSSRRGRVIPLMAAWP